MNRELKRKLHRYDKLITRIARKLTMKRLKELEIDYTVVEDRIISTRQKDVERTFNQMMMVAVSDFTQSNGNIKLLKELYNLK